ATFPRYPISSGAAGRQRGGYRCGNACPVAVDSNNHGATIEHTEGTELQKDSRLLRIGVLGAGPISQAGHFQPVRKARNAELYATGDAADDWLPAMATIDAPGVTYRDYDQMLADPPLEAVVLAPADQFHVPLARKAIAAGRHVLVEK